VLCQACQIVEGDRRRAGLRDFLGAIGHPDGLGVLLCQKCGAVLPAVDTADNLLHKLSQLAQFGIGAGSGPLLSPTRKDV
jgi:hypothetical protein